MAPAFYSSGDPAKETTMNVWKDKDGRPVGDCRIIEMLRALDSNAASLIFFSRELANVHNRIIKIIESLYRWDMDDSSVISDAEYTQAVNDSFITASKGVIRSHINREEITSILKNSAGILTATCLRLNFI